MISQEMMKIGDPVENLENVRLDLKKILQMINEILDYVELLNSIQKNPEISVNIRDEAVIIRSLLLTRLKTIEDLMVILRDFRIEIWLKSLEHGGLDHKAVSSKGIKDDPLAKKIC